MVGLPEVSSMNKLFKLAIVSMMIFQFAAASAFANFDNIKVYGLEDSQKSIVYQDGSKTLIKQEWYGMKIELNPEKTVGNRTYRVVDSAEYTKAINQVKIDLKKVGEYNVYFLDQKVKGYEKAMALSFNDNSTVVFGTLYGLSKTTIHKLAVHELGHQVDSRLMTADKWNQYRQLRGIQDQNTYSNSSDVYTDRPQEIFAEDFRMLFGDDMAKSPAHLNKDLKNPNDVQGLKEFFEGLVK